MKRLVALWAVALLGIAMTGCEYDDSELRDKVDGLDARVTAMEQAAKSANTDIGTLKTLVEALQKQVTVTSVAKTADGYTIAFSDGQTATISNGRDGIDAPVVSVKKDADGVYYWTLGGEFIVVDGRKIKAEGSDGADAVAPQVRINPTTKEWEISTDGGQKWTSTGVVAEGRDGAAGDSIFKDVDPDDETWVTFTLNDGTVLRVAKTAAFDFAIAGAEEPQMIKYGTSRSYTVTAAGVADYTISRPDGWRAAYAGGELTVTAPAAENPYAEKSGEIAVHVTSAAGACKIVKMTVEASEYELRVLTFEDEDYKGGDNMVGQRNWSSLIDTKQMSGPLLYPSNDEELYRWSDENNTFLASELPMGYGDNKYWGGGHAISNYVEMDLANGDFMHQLAVYYRDPVTGFGGHKGSKNFCVHYGYRDDSGFSAQPLPYIYFGDGEARVVDHMYVMWNTYLANCVFNGNGLTEPLGPSGYVKIVAIGYDADGEKVEPELEFFIAGSGSNITEWTKWDLSALGKVSLIEFNMTGDSDNGYGFSQPAYFCYDDVAVRF